MNRIREFRLGRGWSLQKLADAVGTNKSQIDKLEKGFRRLTVDWMVRLAKPLKVDPRELMAGMVEMKPGGFEPVKFGVGKNAPKDGTVPVRSIMQNKANKRVVFTPSPIDHMPRPYFLSHVKDAYAIYMVGEVMIPMYRPRQLLFVNPHKMPLPGNGVVVTDKRGIVVIRELVKQDEKGVVLREYQPKRREFTVEDVTAVHVVVGVVEG